MIFAKFLLFTNGRRSVQTGATGVRHTKINSVVRREIDDFALPYKDFSHYEDFFRRG